MAAKNTNRQSESIWLQRAWAFKVAEDITAMHTYNKQNVVIHCVNRSIAMVIFIVIVLGVNLYFCFS